MEAATPAARDAVDERAPAVGGAPRSREDRASGFARFEREFDRCGPSLYRYFVVRTGDPHLADDLMQQLWVQARPGGSDLPDDRIEPWLRAIAKNLVRTHWRTVARRPAHRSLADAAALLTGDDVPDSILQRREIQEQLLLAITSLPAADQELIVGCYFDELPHATLGAQLGISERAVEGRLYRARTALRSLLKSRDLDW